MKGSFQPGCTFFTNLTHEGFIPARLYFLH
jgi:hypothetical protein